MGTVRWIPVDVLCSECGWDGLTLSLHRELERGGTCVSFRCSNCEAVPEGDVRQKGVSAGVDEEAEGGGENVVSKKWPPFKRGMSTEADRAWATWLWACGGLGQKEIGLAYDVTAAVVCREINMFVATYCNQEYVRVVDGRRVLTDYIYNDFRRRLALAALDTWLRSRAEKPRIRLAWVK